MFYVDMDVRGVYAAFVFGAKLYVSIRLSVGVTKNTKSKFICKFPKHFQGQKRRWNHQASGIVPGQ